MNVVIRTDASTALGSGHVMRCMTLAEELSRRGGTVAFVCRIRDGHMRDTIAGRGFDVLALAGAELAPGARGTPAEVGWQEDAAQTQAAIKAAGRTPDWLVVDHYSLDHRWEGALRNLARHIMVIDDLANRPHDCDLLLDQNFPNPRHGQYALLLPSDAHSLLGSEFALVRPEFARHRTGALARRNGQLQRVLVSMGGTDPANDTATALTGLARRGAATVALDVVIGAGNPHRQAIRSLCDGIKTAELHIQTSRMAELMTRADLAITAGGSTTWERCVLGIPAIVTIQSADQAPIAEAVQRAGGQRVLGWSQDIGAQDYDRAFQALTADDLMRMSKASATLCDGRGAERVATHLLDWNH
jgi:UDP-2,4-diacetamido-2,4,6-trideoxy-beta-L-altropyranose hydrolase